MVKCYATVTETKFTGLYTRAETMIATQWYSKKDNLVVPETHLAGLYRGKSIRGNIITKEGFTAVRTDIVTNVIVSFKCLYLQV